MEKLDCQRIITELSNCIKNLWQNEDLSRTASIKGKYEIVTETDIRFEKEIIACLNQIVPDISILGEETCKEIRTEEQYFTIDPIDGTSNFYYGVPIYGTQVALIEKEEPVLGIVYLPTFDYLFTAVKNQGAFLNGKPIKVDPDTHRHPMIALSDFRIGASNLPLLIKLAEIECRKYYRTRMPGCICFDLAMVACGVFQGKMSVLPNLYDVAPGIILVREAGGFATTNEECCIAGASKEIYDDLSNCYMQAKVDILNSKALL